MVAGADQACVVGVDFGTLSGRAVVVRAVDGAELGSAVHDYRNGVMDMRLPATGEPLPPDWALQDPEDYRDVLRSAVPAAIAAAGIDSASVVGIGTDFTACTILPVLADGTPLCQLPDLAGRPHAYVKLWKHHAAQPQADRINALAHQRGESWIARYGGKISAEWQFAKGLQLLEEDLEIYQRAERWIEAADWIIWQLCGTETRNACTAGYKGIWQDGHYPSREFLAALNPEFAGFADDKLAHPVSPLGARAGSLTGQAAAWTGLTEGIAVAVGNVDAHVTPPAANAIAAGQMVIIMGTSNCHVMNGTALAEVPGMCGVVDGGIVAGRWGYEAGQTGVGDIFAWIADHAVPAPYTEEAARRGMSVHDLLSAEAAAQPAGANELIMQVYADVTRRPLGLVSSGQGPALGSAIHAAVAAGVYPDVPAAAAAMGSHRPAVYAPDPASADVYDDLYAEYVTLHDYFGRGANEVLHRLRAMRDRANRARQGQAAQESPS